MAAPPPLFQGMHFMRPATAGDDVRERRDGLAPLDDVVDDSRAVASGYVAPGQDKTRSQYHGWFKKAEERSDVDAGGEGLKNAAANFESSWYIACALTMTVGFALILVVPKGQHPDSPLDDIAKYSYVLLVVLGTVNAMLGVWWAGHMVPQVYWHPAAYYSKFWFAAMNTSMGHAQQFAKISLEQLLLSLLPLCYLNTGFPGLAIAVACLGYFHLQKKTWTFLMQRMRDAYDEGMERGTPVLDDVSSLPQCCKGPYIEGFLGLATCQLVGTLSFSLRWMCAPRRWRNASASNSRAISEVSETEESRALWA